MVRALAPRVSFEGDVPDPTDADPGPRTGHRPLVFVSDTTAEGERLGAVLRARGYSVVDVPTDQLAERASGTLPSLIVCDVDAPGARDALLSVLGVPESSEISLVVVGESDQSIRSAVDLVGMGVADSFARPLDIAAMLRRAEILVGAPSSLPGGSLMPPARSSRQGPASGTGMPPPSRRMSSGPSPADAPPPPPRVPSNVPEPASEDEPGRPSLVPPDEFPLPPVVESSGPPGPRSPRANDGSVLPEEPANVDEGLGDSFAPWSDGAPELPSSQPFSAPEPEEDEGLPSQMPQAAVSPELTDLLTQAEERVRQRASFSSSPPSEEPEVRDELASVIPPEILASLEEPLDVDDDEDESHGQPAALGTRGGSDGSRTGSGTGTADHGTGAVAGGTDSRAGTGTGGVEEVTSEVRAGPSRGEIDGAVFTREVTGAHQPPSTRAATGGTTSAETEAGMEAVPESLPPGVAGTAKTSAPPALGREAQPTSAPPASGGPSAPTSAPPALGREAQPTSAPPAWLRATPLSSAPPGRASDAPTPPPPSGQGTGGGTESGAAASVRPSEYDASFRHGAATLSPDELADAQQRQLGTLTAPAMPRVDRSAPAPPHPTGSSSAKDVPREATGHDARLEIPSALGPKDSARAMARIIRSHHTGSLALESSEGIRRIVFRDGDFATAASSVEGESLIAFLIQRGALPAEVAQTLGRKIPPFGRHAGAALIAHGYLRQDELWSVLRAHAEWLIGKAIRIARGVASLEEDVPARLETEPAVFGGATGAEVFVEIVRRVISPQLAVERLGGGESRLADGPTPALLGECALADHEVALVNRAKSTTVEQAVEAAPSPDLAAVLYALAELGVLRRSMPTAIPPDAPDETPAPLIADLDDEARRARILSRKALVEEGDYFAVLGLHPSATAYDIRRAYVDLRHELEPHRILTAATVDLRDDLDDILAVLDEAFEILRDQVRRDRYRRALEASP